MLSKSQDNLLGKVNGSTSPTNDKELVKVKPFKSKSASHGKIRIPKMFKSKKKTGKGAESKTDEQDASEPEEVDITDDTLDSDLALARYEKGRVRRLSQHFTQIAKVNIPTEVQAHQPRKESKPKLDVSQIEITSVPSATSSQVEITSVPSETSSRSSSTSRSEYQSYKTSKSSSVSSKSQSGSYTFWHQHDPELPQEETNTQDGVEHQRDPELPQEETNQVGMELPREATISQDGLEPKITAVKYKDNDSEKTAAPSIESLFVPPPESEPVIPKDIRSRSPSITHLTPIKYTPKKSFTQSSEQYNKLHVNPTSDDEKIFNYNVSYKSRESIVSALALNDLDSLLNRKTAVVMKRPPEPPSNAFHMAGHTGGTDRQEHLYKILVIGELGTGKTSIIKRYVHQFFSQHYRATIGVDFALKVLNWDSNTVIRLQLWDIAGQERFGNMTRVYYKEAVGAFIVFDATRSSTFDCVSKWKNDLDTKVTLPNGAPIPTVLIANKCDQPKEGAASSPAKMDDYCKESGFAGWFETSAKENINIDEAAKFLVNQIMTNEKSGFMTTDDNDNQKFSLEYPRKVSDSSQPGSSCKC